MNGKLEKVKNHRGIYRRGGRYIVIYSDPQGRQRRRYARTLSEARDVKATLRADVTSGEYRASSKVTFADYGATWIKTYAGRTARGIREHTRADYRKRLEQDAIPFFGRMPLAAIEPQHVKQFAAHVSSRGVAANTVRLALAPVKALFTTAVEEGILRYNPTAGIRLALASGAGEADEERVKALTEDELRRLLDEIANEPGEWRLFFEFPRPYRPADRGGDRSPLAGHRPRPPPRAGAARLLPGRVRPAEVEVRPPGRAALARDGAGALAAPRWPRGRRARLHVRAGQADRPVESHEPRLEARGRPRGAR